MKYVCLFLMLFCFISCDYFDKKKINADEILNQELKTVNWNEVDEYPSFSTCDTNAVKEQRRQCFESTITSYIFNHLNAQNIIVSEEINDTLRMQIQVSEKGQLDVLNIKNTENIKAQILNIDTLLLESLRSLPEIYPAIKRGQHVKTEFELPVIIEVN